ncbi:MAG: diaminopimelate decarboxylase [Gammaproteobacteria bacterium]|nr:diaminopimelate decarboxylase [Gammaproteobacteria bacterium]
MTFRVHEGVLHAGQVSLADIAAAVGTPTYVYSSEVIAAQYAALQAAFPGAAICYAVKANSNLGVLRFVHGLGAGFDIVSSGELQRVLAAGAEPGTAVFSGVGKSVAEIDLALKLGIGCFNVESEAELHRLATQAELLQGVAPVAVRVNPDVDADTHPYIATGLKENKFGVSAEEALELYALAGRHPYLEVKGIACHIGSQIDSPGPYLEALDRLLEISGELDCAGVRIEHIDVGGGFGIAYGGERALDVAALGTAVTERMAGRPQRLLIEPGRFLTASAGVLLTRIEYLKQSRSAGQRSFVVVDAAMNDLLRPALYGAWHAVERVDAPSAGSVAGTWDVVGPVCETGDFLARDRELTVAAGDLLAVRTAGAYGMALSSNYNSRGRPAEVLVEDGAFRVVRHREHIGDQLSLERPSAEREQ